ncbi:MAG: hypothetical protein FOGNACKC_01204 [Anaerolineae bacterium]|nr:hypothetical protein [Anaerolineae bacterium]
MISILPGFWSWFLNQVSQVISRWTKPATTALIIGAVVDLTRNRTDLLIENALLRQQLIILNRQVERPHFTPGDRWRLVLLARLTRFWDQALLLVQPETLLRWHRELFRLYWRHKSSRKKQEPRLSRETIALGPPAEISHSRSG